MDSGKNQLRLVDITKSFPSDQDRIDVLDCINLSISPGEFVSILGPSSCGKSTIFNLIVGLIQPDSGVILLGDVPIRGVTGNFAYMQQNDLLLPWRTVIQNAVVSAEIQDKQKTKLKARATELLAWIGLKGFEKSYPVQLSGGMRQRVALIRTLLLEKEMLLLDEPFCALDAITRSSMYQLLLEIWQEWEKTVLLITHDIEEALLFSDRVYILSDRPATVRDEIYVELERPRSVTNREFISYKQRLLDTLGT
ncbi:TPA: ABC transporter ATP-binding protein [Candidatus Poribacteria bacterium]|jgi:ABC-type nitrate/sulfonate/bicarbonate transport system ATPase subunit|nr:ABC transporter ATP-binding protein [Candidatus Poribacteria bacterium]HIN30974.1 ABC transporter ATP-binding protein [Candidatus Poribacteria bacterium]